MHDADRSFYPEPSVLIESQRLSSMERRVLTRVAAGMTDREVACSLDASVGQVRYAVRDSITRLGARTRTEAVAIAISHGLIRFQGSLA
jgi:DNA-binding CsgD family transcriptional regulator